MKRILTTMILASAAGMCMAADFSDQITWYSGPFSSKVSISNMTVNTLGQLNAVFEAPGVEFKMNGAEYQYKAVTTGPDGYSYTGSMSQAAGYNYSTGQVEPQPAFQFRAAQGTVDVPGEYTVTIPAGAFSINGVNNDEMAVVFTIKDNRTYTPVDFGMTASPDPILPTDDLREVLLTFNNLDANEERMYNHIGASPTIKPTITKADGTPVECSMTSASAMTGKLAYKVVIAEGALDGPGKYTLTIPEGAIRLSSAQSSAYYTNTTVSYTYTYTGEGKQTVDIADQVKWFSGTSFSNKVAINESLNGISMLFGVLDNGMVLRVNSGRPKATLTGPENFSLTPEITQSKAYDYVSGEVVDQNGFQVNGMPNGTTSVTVPGEYTLSIPEGALSIDGYDNKAFTAKFTVKDTRSYVPTNFTFNVKPIPGDPEVIALADFKISFSRLDADGKVAYRSLGVKHGATATIAKTGGETVELPFESAQGSTSNDIAYKIDFQGRSFNNGEFTVTIPEGVMLIGSEGSSNYYTNKTQTYVYKFEGGSKPVYTSTLPIIRPENGTTVKGLAGIQLESPSEGLEIVMMNENPTLELTLPDGSKKSYEVLTYPSNILMNIPFYSTYTQPGEYKLTVPRDALKFINSQTGEEYISAGFDITYNVTGGTSVDMDYTLATTEGEIDKNHTDLYNLSFIYLTFKEAVTPVEMIYCKVVYPDGSVQYKRATWSGGNKRFMIDLNFPTQIGLYTFTVPEGACYNANGEFNKAFNFEISLLDRNMENLACTVDPENGATVAKLYQFTLKAPEGFQEIYPTNGGITMTYFYNDDTPDQRQMQYLHVIDKTTMQITLDSEITEKGDYTWYIPADAVRGIKADGAEVIGNAMQFNWSIRESGIVNPVGDADTLYTVYTIDGRLVMKQAKAQELNSLSKGIYVINGRTYILR